MNDTMMTYLNEILDSCWIELNVWICTQSNAAHSFIGIQTAKVRYDYVKGLYLLVYLIEFTTVSLWLTLLIYFVGIVTRSRTGISKPKTLDHDSYIVPGSKRRWNAPENTEQSKRVRVEVVSVPVAMGYSDDSADLETKMSPAGKKTDSTQKQVNTKRFNLLVYAIALISPFEFDCHVFNTWL